jgi:hypothetical protein
MNARTTALLLGAGLLTPGFALAQTGPIQFTTAQQARPAEHQATRMYEDVEILRRLLNARLVDEYAPARQVARLAVSDCARCHDPRTAGKTPTPFFQSMKRGATWVDFDGDGYLDLLVGNGDGTFRDVTRGVAVGDINDDGKPDIFVSDSNGTLRWWVNNGPTPKWTRELEEAHRGLPGWNGGGGLDTEGVYLKGHGVVCTLTLPRPAHDPTAETSPPPGQPISPWDRIRRELHGGKAGPTEQKGAAPREVSLAVIVLRVLAENGRHFTELPENESITVVITFRGPEPRPGAGGAGWVQRNPPGGHPKGIQQVPMTFKSEVKDKAGGPSSGQDYELLGDLSLKQGKSDEAIRAYESALKTEPVAPRAAKLFPKIAQAYLAQGKVEEARRSLDRALEFATQKAGPQPAAKPAPAAHSPLPAKLIVSASRRLLDQVGSGRMTFEEFRKEASAEYLTFRARPE